MPADFSARPDGMLNTSADLAAVNSRLSTLLDELNAAGSYFAAHTAGQASDTFHLARAQWDDAMQDMRLALGQGTTALDDITANYQRFDNTAANGFTLR